jgi:hypothetical protein
MAEQYINFVTRNSIPKAMTLDEILKATNDDAALTELRAQLEQTNGIPPL